MEVLNLHSHKTELNNRTLWFDGDSTVSANNIESLIASGIPVDGLFVDQMTDDIKRYNTLVCPGDRITVKESMNPLSFEWNIPEEFKQMDLRVYLRTQLIDEAVTRGWIDPRNTQTTILGVELTQRMQRVQDELLLYKSLQLTDVLRVLIYVINTLQANDVVWGVGRGSSVASYVLYLVGVHDIDSVQHELNITDFLREAKPIGE